MRTTFTLTCFLLFAVSTAFAQNWRLFDPAREYYYHCHSPYSFIEAALRVDSFRVAGNDTMWFPNKIQKPPYYLDTCWHFQPIAGNFGDHIIQYPDGRYDFVYPSGDTIHWDMTPSGPWRCFTNPPGEPTYIVNAVPLGYGVRTVLGVADSVMRVKVTFSGVAYGVDTVLIGKEFGLITPFFMDTTADQPYGLIHLRGISNPNIGVHNIPKEAFFPMQAGDTIQIRESLYDGWDEAFFDAWTQDIYLATSQSSLGDTLFFVIDRSAYFTAWNSYLPANYRDTIIDTIPIGSPLYSRLDRDWGEIYITDLNASAWSNTWYPQNNYARQAKPLNLDAVYRASDSCLTSYYHNFPEDERYFLEGLGGQYFDTFHFPAIDWHYRWPTFWHVGTDQGGRPFNIDSMITTGSQEPSVQNIVSVFPNPATTTLNIDASRLTDGGNAELELIGANGVLYQKRTLAPQDATTQLDVSTLPRGLYIVKIAGKQGVVTRKILLQ